MDEAIPRQISVGLTADERRYLEARAEQLSAESGWRITVSDVVREAVKRLREQEPLKDEVAA